METTERGLEDLRVGYQTAVQMAAHEGDGTRRLLAGFLVVNTVLLAAAGVPLLLRSVADIVRVVAMLLVLIGVVACGMWAVMMVRSHQQHRYWLYSASELERLLSPGVRSFQRGDAFAGGQIVHVYGAVLQMPWYTRLALGWGSAIIVGLFLLAYLLIFAVHLSGALAV